MRFANDSGFECPVDEEGDPLYYDYVLVFGQDLIHAALGCRRASWQSRASRR
ncbi:hypothetical protein [Streptomyces sp. NPDC053069]|uniref:hypothetical protein n=1 Tax=Streptomyces sp. NPDC053069 TaxID=3365695 RepID=UPI0037D7BC7E